jgi:hypothetical protein
MFLAVSRAACPQCLMSYSFPPDPPSSPDPSRNYYPSPYDLTISPSMTPEPSHTHIFHQSGHIAPSPQEGHGVKNERYNLAQPGSSTNQVGVLSWDLFILNHGLVFQDLLFMSTPGRGIYSPPSGPLYATLMNHNRALQDQVAILNEQLEGAQKMLRLIRPERVTTM